MMETIIKLKIIGKAVGMDEITSEIIKDMEITGKENSENMLKK